jgi:hypothetical protein
MRTRVFVFLSVLLICRGDCVQIGADKPSYGRVEILASDILGQRVSSASVELFDYSGLLVQPGFKGSVDAKLAYGKYKVRVFAPGFYRVEREFVLDQPDLTLRTRLVVAIECGPRFTGVHGSVKPSPGDREIWIKFVPVLGTGDVEVRVSRDGKFVASGLELEEYILLVLDGNSVVHSQTVQASARTNIEVDLRGR